MKRRNKVQRAWFPILLVVCYICWCIPAYGFWEKLADAIAGAALGQSTKFEQVLQLEEQYKQLTELKEQTEYLIQNSKRYSGDNAWRASAQLRDLTSKIRAANRNGRHISASAQESNANLIALLPDADEFDAPMTSAERREYTALKNLVSRNALRDNLRATNEVLGIVDKQLVESESILDEISRDLSNTDSQLEALQLIGASTTQTNQHIQVLARVVIAQTELLSNVQAKLLADEDREKGTEDGKPEFLEIVPAHQVDALRSEGVTVKEPHERLQNILKRLEE